MASCRCDDRLPMVRIVVERPTYAQDTANEQIASWVPYATFYGTTKAASSRDVVQAEQVQGSSTWLLELPYGNRAMGITGEMRCRFTYGRSVTAYCDGSAMPVGMNRVRVRAMEQTA